MFIEYPQHTAIPPPLPQWYSDLNGTDLTQLYSPSMGKKIQLCVCFSSLQEKP